MTHKKGLARQTIVMAFLSCRRGRGRTKKVPFLDRAWQIRRAADGDFFLSVSLHCTTLGYGAGYGRTDRGRGEKIKEAGRIDVGGGFAK